MLSPAKQNPIIAFLTYRCLAKGLPRVAGGTHPARGLGTTRPNGGLRGTRPIGDWVGAQPIGGLGGSCPTGWVGTACPMGGLSGACPIGGLGGAQPVWCDSRPGDGGWGEMLAGCRDGVFSMGSTLFL